MSENKLFCDGCISEQKLRLIIQQELAIFYSMIAKDTEWISKTR